MKEKTELQQIREAFGASQKTFGKIFLGGVSKTMIYFYETRKKPVPEKIMMLARCWKDFLDKMKGNKNEDAKKD